jgi:octaprenyl-diphosphate synthase
LLRPDFIQSIVSDDMAAVDRLIRDRLESEVALIRLIAEYIIGSGGKRLRPALLILAAKACGYSGQSHIDLAVVIEFIHTATLLHDDVVDESELRRGRKTANGEFGNAASVLVGDFIYSRAFQLMVTAGNSSVMKVLADATNTIAEGEVLQLVNTHNSAIAEADYLRIIRSKTAKLFEAAAQIGAILGEVSEQHQQSLARYGMHLGTAFQLVDDVLDYSGDAVSTGKNLGDDLNEGKTTLPLIHVIQHGSLEHAAIVRQAIEKGGRDGFVDVLDAIKSTDALSHANRVALKEVERARAAIVDLPPSIFKDCLLKLALFAVERDN